MRINPQSILNIENLFKIDAKETLKRKKRKQLPSKPCIDLGYKKDTCKFIPVEVS